MTLSFGSADVPRQGSAFDELLGECFAGATNAAFERLAASGGSSVELARAVLSAAAVSAHWLLTTDEDFAQLGTTTISAALRRRFENGERPDRDVVDWAIGICAAVLVAVDLPTPEQSEVLALVSESLDLGGILHEFGELGAMSGVQSEHTALLERATEALCEGIVPEGEQSPLALELMTERFREFLESFQH